MTAAPPPVLAVADTSVLLAAFNRKDDDHERAVKALTRARILVVSPLVLAELDHLLTTRAGKAVAAAAVTRLGALARTGALQIATVDGDLLADPGTLNASLAWRLERPVLLSTVQPPHPRDAQPPLEVIPGPATR
ncbi:PIN domain-containing protein [Streptomyces sp. BBFR2]|uniref:PIN domain-containing protein n=1 Tax=Streptomyces sp. BBFR2 TaxID=3372854 RepID=UPI0037D9E6E7